MSALAKSGQASVWTKQEGEKTSSSALLQSDKSPAKLPDLQSKMGETERSAMQVASFRKDLIPEELLVTLTSAAHPYCKAECSKASRTSQACKIHGLRCPDPVWHHPQGRKKYKYLLDQPVSLTGAGRDISFLWDAVASKKDHIPLPPTTDRANSPSSPSPQKTTAPVETLIPEEYHIVKSKGVKGLEFYEDKYTVLLEDEDKMLRIFPSMKPSGRLEAVQLLRVMDEMLDKAGVNLDSTELTGVSQVQGLLDLVQVEQNIYNIVFHEVIRQVSVECAERGQILAKLRQRYVALLDRIPRKLRGLHKEMLSLRALDRRLTDEIVCFKKSIAHLNEELSRVKEHDENVSEQAARAQKELSKALDQSQRSSDMVGEYHDLYEMQRRRLERQVLRLTDERDLWSGVTYSLALKVIKLNNLQLVSRLHVSEQTWTKTAEHFTVFLASKDAEDLNSITQLMDRWKEQLTDFVQKLKEIESTQCEKIKAMQEDMNHWHDFILTNLKKPDVIFDKASEEKILLDLNEWSMMLTTQCERYGGEELLSGQETINALMQLQETWVEVGLQVFRRHPAPDGEPPKGQEAIKMIGRSVSELHKQMGTRINGESGIHKELMSLVGALEFWISKLKGLSGRSEGLPHCDWLKMEKGLTNWTKQAEKALQLVDSVQCEPDRIKQRTENRIEMDNIFSTMQDFMATQTNFFDCENLRLSEEVSSIHTMLTRWMVDLLLLMVPDHCDDQEPVPVPGLKSNVGNEGPMQKLEEDAKNVSQKVDYFSTYITCSCQAIVEEEVKKNMSQDETENELYELNKLQRECGAWVDACGILLSDVKGAPVQLQVSGRAALQFRDESPTLAGSQDSLMDVTTPRHKVTEKAKDKKEEKEHEMKKKKENKVKETKRVKESEEGEEEEEDDDQSEQEEGASLETEGGILKLIGHDGNIIERTLGEDKVPIQGTTELVVRPQTPNAQRAFDALATVDSLQQELLEVEVRAQGAEARALQAEEALQAALEKIQDLERKLEDKPSLENKATMKPMVGAAPLGSIGKKPSSSNSRSEGGKRFHKRR
ncbi:hypothetical protein AALO_G00120060 [Alosa alosa]|uniref:Axonemal dynein light chain domain-containing protein 1 n=1 Tax=Alosa alosa TaxID=278164 RepID=A0AAV6GNM3_9TELE|nr:axonemal dynein light chain domain-containing protein 1 [Alosa alosa]KAG5275416.1 hypothetical protein AALO_G00120060 [Alosa alosa]